MRIWPVHKMCSVRTELVSVQRHSEEDPSPIYEQSNIHTSYIFFLSQAFPLSLLPSTNKQIKDKNNSNPKFAKVQHTVQSPHLRKLCPHRALRNPINPDQKSRGKQAAVQVKYRPCTGSDTKQNMPHNCALFFLTTEVTLTRKPRSHPTHK